MVAAHHWAAAVAPATSIAHKGAVAGAKALAASAMDFLLSAPLVEQAKKTHREELSGVDYRPLLPVGQKPPVDLNKELMERYRMQMREHYLEEKPEFR